MTMLSSAAAERGDMGQIKKQAIIVNSSLFICVYLAVQGSKFNVQCAKRLPALNFELGTLNRTLSSARLRPADAALLEPETGQQARHSDRRTDCLDDRNAELILEPVWLDVHGTLADAHRDNDLGASLDEPPGFADKVLDDLIMVRRQIRQIETCYTEVDNMMLHAVTAHDAAQERHLALVINDQAKPITYEGRDMQSGFRRTDNGNVHRGLAAVNAQFQGTEGHDGIIAFFLGSLETFDECRCHQLNFGRRHPVEVWTSCYVHDPDLDFRRRVRQRHVGASLMFLRGIATDDKSNSNHVLSFIKPLPVLLSPAGARAFRRRMSMRRRRRPE